MTEPGVIRVPQWINHPPAQVWKALTDPAIHARWWASGDVKAVVGHRFTLDMGPWGQQPCEVIAVEPERLLSYSFAPGTLDTTITWRLEPENSGTRLHLEHSGFDLDSPLGKMAFDGMGGGWPKVLERMAPDPRVPWKPPETLNTGGLRSVAEIDRQGRLFIGESAIVEPDVVHDLFVSGPAGEQPEQSVARRQSAQDREVGADSWT